MMRWENGGVHPLSMVRTSSLPRIIPKCPLKANTEFQQAAMEIRVVPLSQPRRLSPIQKCGPGSLHIVSRNNETWLPNMLILLWRGAFEGEQLSESPIWNASSVYYSFIDWSKKLGYIHFFILIRTRSLWRMGGASFILWQTVQWVSHRLLCPVLAQRCPTQSRVRQNFLSRT